MRHRALARVLTLCLAKSIASNSIFELATIFEVRYTLSSSKGYSPQNVLTPQQSIPLGSSCYGYAMLVGQNSG